jgi:hypothetical protein
VTFRWRGLLFGPQNTSYLLALSFRMVSHAGNTVRGMRVMGMQAIKFSASGSDLTLDGGPVSIVWYSIAPIKARARYVLYVQSTDYAL